MAANASGVSNRSIEAIHRSLQSPQMLTYLFTFNNGEGYCNPYHSRGLTSGQQGEIEKTQNVYSPSEKNLRFSSLRYGPGGGN